MSEEFSSTVRLGKQGETYEITVEARISSGRDIYIYQKPKVGEKNFPIKLSLSPKDALTLAGRDL